MIKLEEFKNSKVEAIQDFIAKEGIERGDLISFGRYFDTNQGQDIATLVYFKEEEQEEEQEDEVFGVEIPDNVSIT
jgi:hypothetical protein